MRLPSLLTTVPRAQEELKKFRQLVSFRIGEEEFGVDILMVQEIIRLPTITPIPNAPPSIQGMINLRGKIIPVIDLCKRLRMPGSKPVAADDRRRRILIVEMSTHVTGFIVDSVSEVMKVPESEIEPAPHFVTSSIDAAYIKGVIKLAERLIILLDFRRILKPQEERDLTALDVAAIEDDRIGRDAQSSPSR
jgi:purine-binding chemotaxis protein CheW